MDHPVLCYSCHYLQIDSGSAYTVTLLWISNVPILNDGLPILLPSRILFCPVHFYTVSTFTIFTRSSRFFKTSFSSFSCIFALSSNQSDIWLTNWDKLSSILDRFMNGIHPAENCWINESRFISDCRWSTLTGNAIIWSSKSASRKMGTNL